MAIHDLADSPGAAETSPGKIETTASDGWHASVALSGEIDMALAPALRAELQRHLDAGRCFLRINAAGVSFLDSTALNVLVIWAERCAAAHGSLILTHVPSRVRQIIEITGLDAVLLIHTARDAHAPRLF